MNELFSNLQRDLDFVSGELKTKKDKDFFLHDDIHK